MNQRRTTRSKLPPLDTAEEVEKYEAFAEKKNVKFDKCRHKDCKVEDGVLKCPCGASWSGERLSELFDFLKKRK